jgi:hypothetical protein
LRSIKKVVFIMKEAGIVIRSSREIILEFFICNIC